MVALSFSHQAAETLKFMHRQTQILHSWNQNDLSFVNDKEEKVLGGRNFFKGFLVITALYCCKGIRVIYQMQITKIHVQHVVCMLIRKTKWQQNHLNGSREIYFFLTNILTQHCSLNSGNWPCFSRSVNWNLWRLPQRPRLQECHDSPLTEQNRVFNLSQINTTDTHNDYIYH